MSKTTVKIFDQAAPQRPVSEFGIDPQHTLQRISENFAAEIAAGHGNHLATFGTIFEP